MCYSVPNRIALMMAVRNFLPRCTSFKLQTFNDSIGIRLKMQCILVTNSSLPSLVQSSIMKRNSVSVTCSQVTTMKFLYSKTRK